MIEKLKTLLVRFNPHSKVFIASAFSLFFVILIIVTLQFRVDQSEQNNTSQVTPTSTQRVLIPGKDYMEGQINVKFADGMTDQKINSILADYNARIKSTIAGINVKVVEVPVGQEEIIRKKLIEQGVVKYADLDYMAQALTNDPSFVNQYGLKNTGQSIKGFAGTPNADSKLEPAWAVTKGGGVKIAILDTGIDMNHADLASKVTLQKVIITSSIDDKFGHGTHVAGIAAAVTNNTQGIAGACPDCTMIIGKVLDDSGFGPYSGIAQGVTWAADNAAKVINMSLGGYDNDNTLREAVNYAVGKGAVVVAAAGNDNMDRRFYPGGYDNVVTVAATNNKDQKASFSNYGAWVEVAAAGENILSTFPTHPYVIQNSKGTALNYDYISGTSMATPLVSGIVGLIWASPNGTSAQAVIDKLYDTADKISGTGSTWTKGRVNAQAAVGSSGVTPGATITPGINTTVTPTTPLPTSGLTPTVPVPTYVCGGSPFSVCNTPTPTPGGPTGGANPTITPGSGLTGTPSIIPTVPPGPDTDCLDPRGTPEKIMDWLTGFFKKIEDYIKKIFGSPTDPTPPPVPCVIR